MAVYGQAFFDEDGATVWMAHNYQIREAQSKTDTLVGQMLGAKSQEYVGKGQRRGGRCKVNGEIADAAAPLGPKVPSEPSSGSTYKPYPGGWSAWQEAEF